MEDRTKQAQAAQTPTVEAGHSPNPLLEFLEKYWKAVAVGLGIVVLAAAGYSGYSYYTSTQLKKAQNRLGEILTQTDAAKRLTDLKEFASQSPSSVKNQVLIEIARHTMAGGNYLDAANAWADVAARADDELEIIAWLGQAKCLSLSGKSQEAIAVLEKASAKTPKAYEKSTFTQMAETAERAGDLKKALAFYEKLKTLEVEGANVEYIDYKIGELKARIG